MQAPKVTHHTAPQPLDEARRLYDGRALDLLNAWRGMIRAGLGDTEPQVKALAYEMRRIAREAK